jgi:hypothetical protein
MQRNAGLLIRENSFKNGLRCHMPRVHLLKVVPLLLKRSSGLRLPMHYALALLLPGQHSSL